MKARLMATLNNVVSLIILKLAEQDFDAFFVEEPGVAPIFSFDCAV